MRIAGDPATLIRQGERAHLPSRKIDNAYISDVMRVNCRDRRVSFSFASDRGARVAVVAERSLTRFDLGWRACPAVKSASTATTAPTTVSAARKSSQSRFAVNAARSRSSSVAFETRLLTKAVQMNCPIASERTQFSGIARPLSSPGR